MQGDVLPVAPELSIVVPTFNERGNVAELTKRLATVLHGIAWEVIFVDDDSPDSTAELARSIARGDGHVRCLQRLGRRGLSSACIEGILSTAAPYVAVIDGDLQHDERLLPSMLALLKSEDLDLVVGSRYVAGGGIGDWDESRARISRLATRLGRHFVPESLTDPMSGFFMLRTQTFYDTVRNLSGVGFKILLDVFASAKRPLKFRELPYEFRARYAGESKLDSQAAWDYGMLLLDKLIGHYIPVRFVAFSIVGGLGMFVHLLILSLSFRGLGKDFVTSQIAATMVAMTFNYAVNNAITFRDRRLRGWNWLRGWLSFVIGCSVGAIANVGVASYLFTRHYEWLLDGIAGVLVGAVWNYAITLVYTWGKPQHTQG